jgi:hypothetical protein
MSCFICSSKQISAIVAFACRANLRLGWHSNPGRYAYSPGEEQAAVDILYAANVKSVNARYGESEPEHGCTYDPSVAIYKPIEIIKLCDSFGYQCDEWEGFEGSAAQKIIRDIQRSAVQALPGYDKAEWSIE